MYFQYGEKELAYLKQKDKRLAAAIEQIGMIERAADDGLFASVVHHIVGQQISSKAQATIWGRLQNYLGSIDAQAVNAAPAEALQALGMSMRKALYIKDFAAKVVGGSFDLDAVQNMEDKDAIAALSSLKGIGVWTAEMILLFCLQRRNILSFDDLAIQRGLRMLYHHRKITRKLFAKYRRRYSPYGSVASLYLWAVAGGAIAGMKDYGAQKQIKRKKEFQKRVNGMIFRKRYASPLGEMMMLSDGQGLTNLNFIDDKFYPADLARQAQERELPVFAAAVEWLDAYFAGRAPGELPPLALQGSAFRRQVWQLLLQIPYGGLTTYKELAQKIAAQRGAGTMSAQAVGGAVGHNPICIMVPCHRVVGTNGSLTGYAGGLWRKERLLQIEGFDVKNLFAARK